MGRLRAVVQGRMYVQMQFADYLVSYALQTLNKCLLKVSTHAELTCKDERVLQEHLSHLQSLWQMMQWSIGKLTHEQAAARLRNASALLRTPRLDVQAGQQLLEFADDRTRALLQDLLAPLETAAAITAFDRRDRLGTLLQQESACWRDYLPLRQVSQLELIEHGMGRAYNKALKLTRRLEAVHNQAATPPGPKRLARTARWICHTANHLDLIRSALTDAGRAQRWHLGRLHNKVEQQLGLELLSRHVVETDLKAKAQGRIEKLLQRQREHLDKQRRKLAAGAFSMSGPEYVAQSQQAVEQLGLQEITLLPLEALDAQR